MTSACRVLAWVGVVGDQVDFDEAIAARRLVIKPTVDEELDHLKRTYYGLSDFLVRPACHRISTLRARAHPTQGSCLCVGRATGVATAGPPD